MATFFVSSFCLSRWNKINKILVWIIKSTWFEMFLWWSKIGFKKNKSFDAFLFISSNLGDGSLKVNQVDLNDKEVNLIYVPQEIQHAISNGLTDGYEFNAEQIKFEECLGKGAFGFVHRARALGITAEPEWTLVAVKTLNGIRFLFRSKNFIDFSKTWCPLYWKKILLYEMFKLNWVVAVDRTHEKFSKLVLSFHFLSFDISTNLELSCCMNRLLVLS